MEPDLEAGVVVSSGVDGAQVEILCAEAGRRTGVVGTVSLVVRHRLPRIDEVSVAVQVNVNYQVVGRFIIAVATAGKQEVDVRAAGGGHGPGDHTVVPQPRVAVAAHIPYGAIAAGGVPVRPPGHAVLVRGGTLIEVVSEDHRIGGS